MGKTRTLLALAATAVLSGPGAGPASAGSGVVLRLQTGELVVGEIVGHTDDGFRFRRWDTGGEASFGWDYFGSGETARLKRLLDYPEAARRETVAGLRVVTQSGAVHEGILAEKGPDRIVLKNRERSPQIPVAAIIRQDPVDLDVEAVFTPPELFERRAKALDATKAASLRELAAYARHLRLYDRAREQLAKLKAADPAAAAEADGLLAAVDRDQVRHEARSLADDFADRVSGAQFDDAKKILDRLGEDRYRETDEAAAVEEMRKLLGEEEASFQKNRDSFLQTRVPEESIKAAAAALGRKAFDRKATFADAQAYAAQGVVNEIRDRLAKQFKASAEEIGKFWDGRGEGKPLTVSAGEGTWLVEGGGTGASGASNKKKNAADAFDRTLRGGNNGRSGGQGGSGNSRSGGGSS